MCVGGGGGGGGELKIGEILASYQSNVLVNLPLIEGED